MFRFLFSLFLLISCEAFSKESSAVLRQVFEDIENGLILDLSNKAERDLLKLYLTRKTHLTLYRENPDFKFYELKDALRINPHPTKSYWPRFLVAAHENSRKIRIRPFAPMEAFFRGHWAASCVTATRAARCFAPHIRDLAVEFEDGLALGHIELEMLPAQNGQVAFLERFHMERKVTEEEMALIIRAVLEGTKCTGSPLAIPHKTSFREVEYKNFGHPICNNPGKEALIVKVFSKYFLEDSPQYFKSGKIEGWKFLPSMDFAHIASEVYRHGSQISTLEKKDHPIFRKSVFILEKQKPLSLIPFDAEALLKEEGARVMGKSIMQVSFEELGVWLDSTYLESDLNEVLRKHFNKLRDFKMSCSDGLLGN